MTRRGTTFQALALMGIGSLLGYAAASGERLRMAVAAPPPSDPGPRAAVTERNSCCTEDRGRGTLLALAERTDAATAGAAQEAKKPNILVIFGDDIGQTNISATRWA